MNRLQRYLLPYLPVVIVPFILLSPILLSGKAMYWGTPSLQFVPWRAYAWETIKSGQVPLWNPLLGMGAPLIANYQSALFYPPNWIYFLLDTIGGIGWAAWGQGLIVYLHLVWAGLGMIFLSRRLGTGVLAQAVAGLAFSLSGYIVSRSGFLSINAAVPWLPWMILAIHNVVIFGRSSTFIERTQIESSSPRTKKKSESRWTFTKYYIFLALVSTLLFLTGHAQTAWYTLLLCGLWVIYLSWVIIHQRTLDERNDQLDIRQVGSIYDLLVETLKNLVVLASAFFFAFSLAAIQLIPTIEYLFNSQRANAVGYEFAMTYSFWPWHFLTLIAPDIFGSPVTGDYWGYGFYWEDAIFIGLLPFIFAIIEIIQLIRNRKHPPTKAGSTVSFVNRPYYRNSLVIFLIFVLSISFVLALGNNTPIFPWLYHNIPSFSLFQAPARISIWGVFALVVLSALGVDQWRSLGGRSLYWARLATAGSLAVTIGAGLAMVLIEGINSTFIRAAAVVGLNGFIIGVLALTNQLSTKNAEKYPDNNQSRVWRWAVTLYLSISLLVAGWAVIPGIDLEFYKKNQPIVSGIKSILNDQRLYLPGKDENSLKFDRFKRRDTYDPGEDWNNLRAVMLPNLTLLDGISSANNFDPLVPSRYAKWMEALQELETEENDITYLNLLNLMGVGMVETINSSNLTSGVEFSPVLGSKRIRWVPCAIITTHGDDTLAYLIQADFNFDELVIIEEDNFPPVPVCEKISMENYSWEYSILVETPNRLDLIVDSEISGWLVVSDVWYPGWFALIDGKANSILHANYLFRGIFVESGTHKISFVYRPLSFIFGFGLSIISWLTIIVLWVISRRREYSNP